MKCKLDHELSKLKEFANDKEHQYLRAVFVPERMNLLQSLSLGNQAQYVINIYPGRDADGNIIEEQQKALIEGFNAGVFDKETYYVDRVAVEVEPFVMKRSRDSQFGKKGEIIMDGGNARVYNTVAITCFHKLIDNKEIPAIDENALKSRALAVKAFRIKNGDWLDLTKYIPNVENIEYKEETPTDEGFDEAQQKEESEADRKRKQLEAELAALNKPERL